MKKLAAIALMLLATGCKADVDDGKTVTQLQAEIAQKQAALERAKVTGGYPNVRPSAVCAYGVLYYTATTYGGSNIYTPAISSETLQPQRCNEAKH